MQAVILAGGKGTRMKHLTAEIPKPMILVGGKNLLQHKIDNLPPQIDEIILVVGYKKEAIMDFFGDSYAGRKITYVDQGEPMGTAHALFAAAPLITGDFISMMGDDLYTKKNIEEILKYPWAMSVYRAKSFPTAIDIQVDEKGYMKTAVPDDEGIKDEILLDICLYKLGKDFLNAPLVSVSNKKEWGLPHTLFVYLKQTDTPIKVIEADAWTKVNSPEDVVMATVAVKTSQPSIPVQ